MDKNQQASHYNSWEHVRELRKKIVSGEYVMSEMEDTWRQISEAQIYYITEDGPACLLWSNYFRTDEAVGDTPFEALDYFLDRGHYPPPEILFALSDCLNLYFEAAGKIELDEVFFSARRIQKLGNYGAQINKNIKFRLFDIDIQMEKLERCQAGRAKRTRSVLAEDFLNSRGDYDTDVRSFLKAYDRWKKSVKKDK